MGLKGKLLRIVATCVEFYKNNTERFDAIKKFLFFILGYGILINYMLHVLFHLPFSWLGFPAFGVAYYFISDEFVTIIRKLKARDKI